MADKISPPPSAGVDAVAVKPLLDFDVREYVDAYEFRGDEGDYQPTERERVLLEDAIAGAVGAIHDAIRSALTPAPTPVGGGGEAGDVWVLFSDGHPLFLSGSKLATDKAKKAYAETGHVTEGPFRYAIAKPAPAVGAVREAQIVEAIATWLERQRQEVPAHGWEFAAALRTAPPDLSAVYLAPASGTVAQEGRDNG